MSTTARSNLFWDSCVFHAYFSNNIRAYDVDSIEQYIAEAKQGRVIIHTCSLVLAEIPPSRFSGRVLGRDRYQLLDRAVDTKPREKRHAGVNQA